MTPPETSSAATVEIYRNNMFRVIGVPIDATSRTVRRRSEEVRIAHELGAPAPSSGGRLPLDPPPDASAISRAAAAWEDPEQRLVDELFWFWAPDSAAVNGSRRARLDQTMMSLHDRAVQAHCTALDLELLAQRQALTPGERHRLTQSWGDAARDWASVLNNSQVWAHLEQRVATIDDPRVTRRNVAELKEAVPARWLAINARLALDAVEAREDEVRRHRRVMQDFARAARLDDDAVDRALHQVAVPTIRRVENACDNANSAVSDDPSAAAAIGDDLRERTREPLAVLTRLLTAEHPALRKVQDGVASALRHCAVKCFNQAGVPALERGAVEAARTSATKALGLLRQAAELASTPSTRNDIAADIAALEGLINRIGPSRPLFSPRPSRSPARSNSDLASAFAGWGLLVLIAGIVLAIAGVGIGWPAIGVGFVLLMVSGFLGESRHR